MNKFVKENLEEYLSGQLSGEQLKQFEQCLERNPRSAAELSAMIDNASLFDAFKPANEELLPIPAPGFYARVREQIAEEEEAPFWGVFLDPFILRRVTVAAFVWLFLIGTTMFYRDGAGLSHNHMAESILIEPPAVADYYVRLGPNLEMNRDTMLSTVLLSGR